MKRYCLLLLALLVALAPALSQDAKQRYTFKKEHDKDGIGKFYMGREIAQVMGHRAAGWLERKEREKEEHSSELIEALKIKPGMKIADVGAGSGYFTFRLAKLVGAEGKIYAVDIQPEMLAIIKKRMAKDKVKNVIPVKGDVDNPRLPPAALDLIIMVDVYHEFSHPHEMIKELVDSLKVGGKLVFVEYRLEDVKVPIKRLHKMSEKQVKKEMEPFDARWDTTYKNLPWQHVIIFERNPNS